MTELTICMNVYNGEEFLDRSVGSIRSQTLHDFKFLVYDDGSTDGTIQKLRSFHDDRMTIIEGGENKGVVYARAKLISMIDTKYFMWIDDDDCFCRNDAFESALTLIKSGDYDVVAFDNRKYIHSDGQEVIMSYAGSSHQIVSDNFLSDDIDIKCFDQFWSKIFRTDLMKKCIPEDGICSDRFIIDETFFLFMSPIFLKRYYISDESPIYSYYDDIGAYGSKKNDTSLDRIRKWCYYMHSVISSCYNRMMKIRNLTGSEKKSLLRICKFDIMCTKIKEIMKTKSKEEAVKYFDLWHEYFGRDGIHLLNDVDDFVMPTYVKCLEDEMNSAMNDGKN